MGGCTGGTGTGGGLSGTWGSSSVVCDALSSSVVDSSMPVSGSIVENINIKKACNQSDGRPGTSLRVFGKGVKN